MGDDVRGFAPGDRAAVAFYVTCGRCRYCREGRDTLCDYMPLERACILADAVATSYYVVVKRA